MIKICNELKGVVQVIAYGTPARCSRCGCKTAIYIQTDDGYIRCSRCCGDEGKEILKDAKSIEERGASAALLNTAMEMGALTFGEALVYHILARKGLASHDGYAELESTERKIRLALRGRRDEL